MSQLGVILQESLRAETEARTILGLLTDQIGAVDRAHRHRRRTLKERLRFNGMGCCGATWVFRPSPLTLRHSSQQQQQIEDGGGGGATPLPPPQQQETNSGRDPNPSGPSGSGMNLAAALAAERQLREPQEVEGGSETAWRVSVMRVVEETTEEGDDWVCCVCMGRKKGAAFIPCGHTFCRVCSREVWLNRGTCPLCNRSILDILDIF